MIKRLLQTCFFLLLLFNIISGTIKAQYPSTPGTVWEYVQHNPDYAFGVPFSMEFIPAFTDSITGDSMINGVSYTHVHREGFIRFWPDPYWSGPPWPVDTTMVTGDWFFRISGDTVFHLDTIIGTTNYDSVFMDLSLEGGDSLYFNPPSHLNLAGTAPWGWPCLTPGGYLTCLPLVVEDFPGSSSTYIPKSLTYFEGPNSYYIDSVGVVLEYPSSFVLETYGQNYYLKTLRNGSSILWENTDILTGVADLSLPAIKIYPNPASDYMILSAPYEIHEIQMMDMNGQMVLTMKEENRWGNKVVIRLDDLPKGLYLLRMRSNERYFHKKIMLE